MYAKYHSQSYFLLTKIMFRCIIKANMITPWSILTQSKTIKSPVLLPPARPSVACFARPCSHQPPFEPGWSPGAVPQSSCLWHRCLPGPTRHVRGFTKVVILCRDISYLVLIILTPALARAFALVGARPYVQRVSCFQNESLYVK